ncbi:MAG: YHS domain-containing protein [Candidatus Bathyarchaeota archaeon]|nr:YHS domain-containing protein [Candidatus Bathyarchaeota archaeon]
MPRDSVCGVVLDEKTSKFKIKHDGETYYFCSVRCKKEFKRNRSKFVSRLDRFTQAGNQMLSERRRFETVLFG